MRLTPRTLGLMHLPRFDAASYFEQLTKTKALTDLMLTDRELKKGALCSAACRSRHLPSQEVRKLDSNLKTLVYNNYSKFISATETIKKVLRLPSLLIASV